jgi:hypothetical protein
MPEAHTSYHGKLLRLSDELVEDFVNDVGIAKGLYNPAELDPDGLGAHTDELKGIIVDFEERFLDDETSTGLWDTLVNLSLNGGNNGEAFLGAYTYTRTNRFLTAEFGRAETESTLVLRGITNELVDEKLSSGSPETIKDFLNMRFPADMLDAIYPPFGSNDLNPLLARHLKHVETMEPPYFDPALVRIISMLVARECEVVDCIPNKVVNGLFTASRDILLVSRRSGGIGSPRISESSRFEDDKYVETELDPDMATEEEYDGVEDDELDLTTALTTKIKFKSSDGACHVKKEPGMTNELHDALLQAMARTMFPSEGKGVIEAQAICAHCKVKTECLDYALENRIDTGIWGGASERERRRILAKRKRTNEEQSTAIDV